MFLWRNKKYMINVWLPALVAQLDAPSDWRPGGRGFNPRRGRQHSFVEIDHEIFSMVIFSLPLIQEGQLSVSGERLCTILVNRLEDQAFPVNVWLGKLTALDMTPLGWLGRKTSTQTNNQCLVEKVPYLLLCIRWYKITYKNWCIITQELSPKNARYCNSLKYLNFKQNTSASIFWYMVRKSTDYRRVKTIFDNPRHCLGPC